MALNRLVAVRHLYAAERQRNRWLALIDKGVTPSYFSSDFRPNPAKGVRQGPFFPPRAPWRSAAAAAFERPSAFRGGFNFMFARGIVNRDMRAQMTEKDRA